MDIHFLDRFSIEWLFVLTVALMLLMLELGFRFGRNKKVKSVKAQTAQVRALMGATLGLLAFMLAFTFAAAQSHFETRLQLQIDEVTMMKTAFMQTDRLQEPVRSAARDLLLELVDGRLEINKALRQKKKSDLPGLLQRAEEIQMELWVLGREPSHPADDSPTGNPAIDGFMNSVLGMMGMQTQRVEAALVNRIPIIIWLTLYFTAVMSMIVVGYQAGLTERRSPVATFSLALAFAAVMTLILDLDRPMQSLFGIDVTVMEKLAVFMRGIP